jgi:hypothetical protein
MVKLDMLRRSQERPRRNKPTKWRELQEKYNLQELAVKLNSFDGISGGIAQIAADLKDRLPKYFVSVSRQSRVVLSPDPILQSWRSKRIALPRTFGRNFLRPSSK